ncbi:MAG TPA: hypothetical protein VH593_07145 [Ktedonobacteraceae bacterium]
MMRIFGFNWEMYTQTVMPAFACWLIERNEEPVQQLYQQTRSAREERVLPVAMHQLRSYARAKALVLQLPRERHASREYRNLCSVEQFTAQSDRYVNLHCPQLLHQNLGALRTVWGAIVEEYCISQLVLSDDDSQAPHNDPPDEPAQDGDMLRFNSDDEIDDISRYAGPPGIELGRHPAFLSLRAWLATFSVRAMALFELLACGRRQVPFGYSKHEPFESFIGYLTPHEVWHLAQCLHNVQFPAPHLTEQDYSFALNAVRQAGAAENFNLPDEIPSEYTRAFTRAVHAATARGLGLICNTA